ncbi:hypothetical protein BGZ47_004552 [Haplosporangium gracile]|nr:hypothetical protein BGZ47_004552 [Haplosporangium gracile]
MYVTVDSTVRSFFSKRRSGPLQIRPWEQLQSLTTPFSLIKQYLAVIVRLEGLKTVDFLPDVVYSVNNEDIDETARTRRAADWRGEFCKEILKLLPPARIIKLTDSTWNQYIAHLLETDLSGIEEIPRRYGGNSWIQGIQNDPLILQ